MAINLSSVVRGAVLEPPRLVVYGPHGVGKTTFAANAPAPILLPFEDGVGTLDIPRFPLLKSWGELMEAFGSLCNEPHEFKTIVVDTLDWLEPLIWAETCARNKWRDIEVPGFGKGYIEAAATWREFFNGLVYIRQQRGMSVILLAHTEVKTFNDPTSDPYDRYQIKLQKRAAELTQEWADAVLFANYRTGTQKTDTGFNRKVTRGVGSGERVLYTEERPAFYAKNRYALPADMDFDYPTFAAAINPVKPTAETAF